MNKTRKSFLFYAMLSLFLLLTLLLGIINGINFTMAANDADQITEMLSNEQGMFQGGGPGGPGGEEGGSPQTSTEESGESGSYSMGRMGPMGTDSPEMRSSVRYFTFRFDDLGNGEKVAMQISAFSEEDAMALAKKLLCETTGWVKFTYRYRVYEQDGYTYVTVIDQGRELLPSYRILLISVIGEIAVLVISYFFLLSVGKRLFKPLEEADAKQKRFIADAESELKIPLTVIRTDTELIEREHGPSESTDSIHRQVGKMTSLVKRLGALAIFEEPQKIPCDLSGILSAAVDQIEPALGEQSIALHSEIEDGITVNGDPDLLAKALGELTDNILKFALTRVSVTLKKEGERIRLSLSNDSDLSEEGNLEQVFDRFTMLSNAEGKGGSGLGLSYVKDIIKSMSGRVTASSQGGTFLLSVVL